MVIHTGALAGICREGIIKTLTHINIAVNFLSHSGLEGAFRPSTMGLHGYQVGQQVERPF